LSHIVFYDATYVYQMTNKTTFILKFMNEDTLS